MTTNPRPSETHSSTAEPESLYGKIDPKTFGDRAYRGKPTPEFDEKMKMSKKKKDRDVEALPSRQSKRRRLQEESVLFMTEECGVYQPKTKETQVAYEALLGIIQWQLGGQPAGVVSGAADEVLAILKNDAIKNPAKKKEIDWLLNPISNHVFDQVASIGRVITDHGGDAAGYVDDALEDDVCVAVQFEEEDEEESESDYDVVQEEEMEEDDVLDSNGSGAKQLGGGINDDGDMQEASNGMTLNVQDVDAYWLQRKISQSYEEVEPQFCQKLAGDVLEILAERDDRQVENRLLVLLAMEVSQMVSQGMWGRDSVLLQLPHFTNELAKKCQEFPGKSIKTVFDLMEMEAEERQELLQMSDSQLLDIARFCNRFPIIDLTYEVLESKNIRAGGDVTLQVTLEWDFEGSYEVGPVYATRYPKAKEEGWWLVVGDSKADQLLAIKRVSLLHKSKVKLEFTASAESGEKSYILYCMCDSYVGCDQEYEFTLNVKEASGAGDESRWE